MVEQTAAKRATHILGTDFQSSGAAGIPGKPRLLATLNGHTVILDGSGKIVPWDQSSANAYDTYLDQRWNFIKTQVPNSPGSPPVSNYPQYYFYDGYLATSPAITPDNWMNDVGEKIPNWVESGRLYYAYTGDSSVMDIVRGLVDYTIDHGTSPSNFAWPNFPQTTNNYGQAEFTGFTVEFALHEIQVDLAADMGLAYYHMYQFYGDQKYLTAAVNVADVLSAHARVGTATQSVWPYRVKLDSGAVTAEYGANWAGAYSLLTQLAAANIGNVAAYTAAAGKVRDFILNYPMQTLLDPTGNMAGNWTDGHSDTPINSNTYKSNTTNSNMALYMLDHPEFDPNWQTDLPEMIQWTETWFVTRTTGGEPATSYGANIVGEQDDFNYKLEYQTARYAAECAALVQYIRRRGIPRESLPQPQLGHLLQRRERACHRKPLFDRHRRVVVRLLWRIPANVLPGFCRPAGMGSRRRKPLALFRRSGP